MSAKITFDGAPESGVIDFGVGQPSADLLPLAARAARPSERFFAHAQPIELNYGEKPGDARFRTALAEFLTRAGGHAASADSLFLTAGTSQALDFVCQPIHAPGRHGFRRGAHVLPRLPDLPGSRSRDRRHSDRRRGHGPRRARARSRTPPAEARVHDPELQQPDGADVEPRATRAAGALERRARFSHRRRRGLPAAALRGAAAAGARDAGWTAATCSRWARSRRSSRPACGSAGSRPTLRGSSTCSRAERIISGGCFNHFGSHVVRQMLEDGSLAELLAELRRAYGARVAAMDEALHEHLGGIASWQKPEGGYFFWVTLPAGSRCRGPAGGRALGRDRLPAGLEVLGHGRHAQLPAAELRVLHRTGNPRRHRAPRQGAARDRSLTLVRFRARIARAAAASAATGAFAPRRRLRFDQASAIRTPART